jgi:ABC-2 type transport system permease protein
MVRAQTRFELRLTLRRGESLLLTLVIPVLLLVFFSSVKIVDVGPGKAVDFLVPGVLALAIMSTAFTGQAIATGFERQYGVLKRLGASPLPRAGLMAAKSLSVLAVEALQVAVVLGVGVGLGWSPRGGPAALGWTVLLALLGTAAFSGLGLLMAGRLRAEATLAAANGLYLVLLLIGGVVVPISRLPGWLAGVGRLLPTAALSDGLRAVLRSGAAPGLRPVALLAGWAVVLLAAAAATFRWE